MSYAASTLCWDCAKATGFCKWSSDLKPIEGWTAEKTLKNTHYGDVESYLVLDCPEFKRDSIQYGLKRLKGDSNET